MKIDRNNYEEYFLLFADDELTDGEKIEVLQFIRDHKDLEGEFKMILDTICKPDDISFEDKLSLLKTGIGELISENNCEEFFVQYHDGELNKEQEFQVECFINGHENYRKDFETIGLVAMLQDDSIVFPGKKYLYKKENAGKVISVTFLRLLAAAVFIGFGLWFFLYEGKQNMPVATIENAVPVPKTLKAAKENSKPKDQVTSAINPVEDNIVNPVEIIEAPSKKEINQASKGKEKVRPGIIATAIKNKKINGDIHLNIVTKDLTPEIAIKPTIPAELISNLGQPNDSHVAIREEKHQEEAIDSGNNEAIAQPASFSDDKTENYVFYNVTTDDFRKTKVGGFLKKIKRIVERSNPITRLLSGDEKDVVANRQFLQ